MIEAKYYSKLDDKRTICELCPKGCIIQDKETGFCKAFLNNNGTLYNTLYEKASSISMDPIEKKPLFHFYPGSKILSIGSIGCNLRCQFCQNWQLIEGNAPLDSVTSGDLLTLSINNNSIGIAFTYNEPIISYEFVLDTFRLFKMNNLKTVLVTNGFINEKPLIELLEYTDALNIDLKSMEDSFYNNICMGKIEPVKRTISLAGERSFIEVTNLVIPGLNDTELNFRLISEFLSNINNNIPLHFSRYFPCYKLNISPTPVSTLISAYNIAREKLKYVYISNASVESMENSKCPVCSNLLIKREGYLSKVTGIIDNKCSLCDSLVNFII